jgi:hypothetical protein
MQDAPRVALNVDAFRALAASRGWTTSAGDPNWSAAARALGLTPGTVIAAVTGKSAPGERFIAAALAVSGSEFGDLFTVGSERAA